MNKNPVDWIVYILVIVGALNWLAIGIGNFLGANYNVVDMALGGAPVVRDVIYIVIGLAALYLLYEKLLRRDR